VLTPLDEVVPPSGAAVWVSIEGTSPKQLASSRLTRDDLSSFIRAHPGIGARVVGESAAKAVSLNEALRDRLVEWESQLRAGASAPALSFTANRGDGTPVSVRLEATEAGAIGEIVVSDPSSESRLGFSYAGDGSIASATVHRSENGRPVIVATLAGPDLSGHIELLPFSPGFASAEAGTGGGDCAWAIAEFISAVFLYEGFVAGAALVAAGLAPGLGPIAIYAIIVGFLGSAGMVGVAARAVHQACGGGEA
jgi:hypothetical protein